MTSCWINRKHKTVLLPPYCTINCLDFLAENSRDRVSSHRYPRLSPAHSPDLSPLYYWLWGELEDRNKNTRVSNKWWEGRLYAWINTKSEGWLRASATGFRCISVESHFSRSCIWVWMKFRFRQTFASKWNRPFTLNIRDKFLIYVYQYVEIWKIITDDQSKIKIWIFNMVKLINRVSRQTFLRLIYLLKFISTFLTSRNL